MCAADLTDRQMDIQERPTHSTYTIHIGTVSEELVTAKVHEGLVDLASRAIRCSGEGR